ncbi:MAG TPA: tetratricopeptide repeat protein [Chitinophagaceae bacterium]|nr:tetratricopeptide repeat protein [Chitinophagaceae bacterium]
MRYIFIILLMFCSIYSMAQSKTIDSLRSAYAREKSDSARADILWEIGQAAYAQKHPDSLLFNAQEILFISKKVKYINGEMRALKQMAEGYEFIGNYPLALQYYLERLQLDEKYPDAEKETVTLLSIANVYELEGDYKQALFYAKKGYDLVNRNKLEDYRWYSYMVFGEMYEKMNDTLNAELYNKLAYELAAKNNDSAWMGMCLNNTGNTYLKAKQYAAALDYYRRGVPFLIQNGNASFLCESYQGIATIFNEMKKPDSAIFYGKAALSIAENRDFGKKYLVSCQLLTSIYKGNMQADSALFYQTKMLVMKDSIYSQEKVRQVESLTLAEQLRQKEKLQADQEEAENRTYQLKMLLVGLLIPFFFLLSILLSKGKIPKRVVEFTGILSLLLLFEYLTLWLHPAVSEMTNHSPFLEIVIFVIIAAILTPSHHRIQHWMLEKLTSHKHHIAPVVVEATPVAADVASEDEESAL